MCTRYLLLEEHYRTVLARLGIDSTAPFASRYNIAPGSAISAVRTKILANGRETGREAVSLQWGLVPAWAKSDEDKLVNARAETLATKPSFRNALRGRRCVIPASGFYEWEKLGRVRKPWLFRRRDEHPFGFAGLWESWRAANGTAIETCTIITTEPNELMRPIHHRMPVMLTPEQFEPWLDPRATDAERLAPLLCPPPAATMSMVAMSSYVSDVRHEGPACLAPPRGEDDSPQFSLGL